MREHDKQQLANDLINVVALAAISTKSFIGTGEKEAGDQAAVDAMRKAFDDLELDGTVQVGEGEKDEAPMLYVGEKVGNGNGICVDIAVDPVEGTTLMAKGLPNAITVIAATEQGGFWKAGSAYYMNKIVVGPKAKGSININVSTRQNLTSIANALNKPISDVTVYVLDKPRHKELIKEIESAGAKVAIHPEGDVVGSVLALIPDSGIDVLMGIGGAPEAVISAAAVKIMGGDMQGKLAPQKSVESSNLKEEAIDLEKVLYLDDLIKTDWAIFAAAGVTSGLLLNGVNSVENSTECLVLGPNAQQMSKPEFQSK